MSKVEEMIEELCPDGVEWVELGEVAEYIADGTHQTPKYQSQGVKFISVENINDVYNTKKYISKEDYDKYKVKSKIGDLMMSRIGTIGSCTVLDKNEELAYYVTIALIRPKQNILAKYIKYVLESQIGKRELYKRTLIHAIPIKINLGDIQKIKIPLPPLPIQEEIVRILDKFTKCTTELIAELTKELDLRKKQYAYYRDTLLTFGEEVEWKTLGEVACYSKEKINAIEMNETNYIGVDNLLQNRQGKQNSNYTPSEGRLTKFNKNDVLIGNIRPYLKKIWFSDIVGGANGDVLIIQNLDETKLLSRYLYMLLSTDKFFDYNIKNSKGAKMPRGNKEAIMNYKIQIPSLSEQQRIVNILDRFDTLTNDLSQGLPAEIELRQKQYEYYRDKLLTFKQKEKKIAE